MDFEELYRVELAELEQLRSATAIPLGLLTIKREKKDGHAASD
jgi:hypothetical protein